MTKCSRRVAYAFPHAGASAAIYRSWSACLNDDAPFKITAVELPGRGTLIREASIERLEDLVDYIALLIHDDFRREQRDGTQDWVTFGHSFGGVLSIAVTARLAAQFGMRPAFCVVSASVAPTLQTNDDRHRLSNDAILAMARADNATPEAILRDPVMGARVATQLRSDYIIRNQFPKLIGRKVDRPIIFLRASDDPHVPAENIREWRTFTSDDLSVVTIDGDHFAVYRNWPVVRRILSQAAISQNAAILIGDR